MPNAQLFAIKGSPLFTCCSIFETCCWEALALQLLDCTPIWEEVNAKHRPTNHLPCPWLWDVNSQGLQGWHAAKWVWGHHSLQAWLSAFVS